MVGDWNTTLGHLDKTVGFPWRETSYRNGLLSLMKELNLVEVYRTLHPNSKTYTYETKNRELKSRIDFFIITKQLINQVTRIETRTSIAPDHKAVFLIILWLCLTRTEDYRMHKFDWLKSILTAV